VYQKERLDKILEILKQNGYVAVKYLVEELHYSNATINRDLNVLEGQKLINRSYGGVELVHRKSVPLPFRYHKMKTAKNKIAKAAAELVCDGDTIFIDGTTTTEYMGKYLTDKKNITVITNNIALVAFLCEYDINVICLGGRVEEKPSMLMGSETVENASCYRADKMFFASSAFTEDGKIGSDELYFSLLRTMVKNSDVLCYMGDHEKLNGSYNKVLCNLSDIDYIITDYCFDDKIKEKYKNAEFIEI